MDYSNYHSGGTTAWSTSLTSSSGTVVGTQQQVWSTGARPESGLHPNDRMWVAVPTKGYSVHAVHPETLHGVCDWALVGCAFGVVVVRKFRDE
jgi:hypothetical protein